MSFGMFYSCALYLTSSKYVLKKYVELKELHKEYASCMRTRIHFGQEGYEMLEQSAMPLKKMADKWQCDFLDLEDIRTGKLDAIHLDEEGHCQVAEKLIKKLGEYR